MIALAILLTGIGSYAMRAFFIFALARYAFPPLLLRALQVSGVQGGHSYSVQQKRIKMQK